MPVDDFDLRFKTLGDPVLIEMEHAARLFMADVEKRKARWVSFCGKSGTGKTHLSNEIKRHWMERGAGLNGGAGRTGLSCHCMFVNWLRFVDRIRSGQHWRVDDLCDVRFAVIDDFGAGEVTSYVKEKAMRIMNERIGKFTVISANMSVEDIAKSLDERIASRMLRGDNVVVKCQTKDYALRMKQ